MAPWRPKDCLVSRVMRRLRTRKPGTKAPGMLCHVTWGNYTHTHTHTHKHTHSHTAVARAGWERGRVFKTKRTLLTNPVMLPWLKPPNTHTHTHTTTTTTTTPPPHSITSSSPVPFTCPGINGKRRCQKLPHSRIIRVKSGVRDIQPLRRLHSP